jgi:hypothetical protein
MTKLTRSRSGSRAVVAGLAAAVGFTVAVLAIGPTAAAADKQTFLGQHGVWYAYRINDDGARTCYMVSKPSRTRGKFKKRGDVVAFVTHRPREGERDVINFQAGFTYKASSTVAVRIGDKSFSLFTSKDTAWSRSASDDKAMVAAMIKGNTMDVTGAPSRGGQIVDTYSLTGFGAAYKKITGACGLK